MNRGVGVDKKGGEAKDRGDMEEVIGKRSGEREGGDEPKVV